jgi:hypothetical protein
MPGERCNCETITRSVPVNDERAIARHQRDLAHIDVLFADLVAVLQAERGVQRRGKRVAVRKRDERVRLGLAQLILHEIKRITPVVAVDREHLVKDGLEPLLPPLSGSDIHCRKS